MKARVGTLGILLLSGAWVFAQNTSPSDAPTTSSSSVGQSSLTGCLSSSANGKYMLTDSTGIKYTLMGNSDALSGHVGQQVQISGQPATPPAAQTSNAGASNMGAQGVGTPAAAEPVPNRNFFQVSSATKVADSCSSPSSRWMNDGAVMSAALIIPQAAGSAGAAGASQGTTGTATPQSTPQTTPGQNPMGTPGAATPTPGTATPPAGTATPMPTPDGANPAPGAATPNPTPGTQPSAVPNTTTPSETPNTTTPNSTAPNTTPGVPDSTPGSATPGSTPGNTMPQNPGTVPHSTNPGTTPPSSTPSSAPGTTPR